MNTTLSRWLVAITTTLAAAGAFAQTYPSKPIRFVVPYAAGNAGDIAARFMGDELSRALGQALVIDNKPGAGGNVGTALAAQAPGDGYTLLMGSNATHAANEFLYAQPGYDPHRDFEPVAFLGILPLVYVTRPANPVNTIAELVAAARAKPDVYNIALSTTTSRLTQELFKLRAGAPLFPVDYRGSAQSIVAVLGGQTEFMVDTISSLRTQITGGQLKALGVTSRNGTRLLPGVKSVAEQGVDGYELVGWLALYMPKGSPASAVQRVSEAVRGILARPDAQATLLQIGVDPLYRNPADTRTFGREEREKWGQLIKTAGIKAQ